MSQQTEEYIKEQNFEGVNIADENGFFETAAKELSEPFLVIDAGVICDFELAKTADFHLKHNSDLTVVFHNLQKLTHQSTSHYWV